MNQTQTFMHAFLDEFEKLAIQSVGKKRQKYGLMDALRHLHPGEIFQAAVHHPVTQMAGYGALTGEGLHELAHRGHLGPRLARWSKSKTGGRMGVGAIAGSAGFLGLEALSALVDLFKKPSASGVKEVPVLKISISGSPSGGKLPRMTNRRFRGALPKPLGFNQVK